MNVKCTVVSLLIVLSGVLRAASQASQDVVDSSFNPSTDGPIYNMALQADGKILIVGGFMYVDGQFSPEVARLNPDGSLDTSFVAATTVAGYFLDMNCVAVDSLGRVYIGGDGYDLTGNYVGRLACVDGNGNVLNSSSTGNPAIIDANGPIYTISGGGQVISIPGGSTPPYTDFLVGGNFSEAGAGPVANIYTDFLVPNYDLFYVLVFNDATTGFAEVDSIGWGAPEYTESEEESPGLNGMGAQDNTVMAIGGWIGGEYRSGNLVVGGTGFDQSGLPFTYGDQGVGNANYESGTTLNFSGGVDAGVLALAIQPDGKVLAGGEFSTIAGYPSGQYPSLARFNTNGTADTMFAPPNDWFMNASLGFADAVDSILVQSDGKVLAGGWSSMFVNGSTTSGLERFNAADGSLDAAFNLPVDGSVATMLQQPDGQIIVAGSFSIFGGQTHLNIARFKPYLMWNSNIGGTVLTPPDVESTPAVGADGTVYVTADDGFLYALDPSAGYVIWGFNVHNTGGEVTSSPSIGADGTIYVCSVDGNLYAVNPNGSIKWIHNLQPEGAENAATPAIGGDGTIYVTLDENANIFAVTPAGNPKWTYSVDDEIESSPTVGPDGTVYVWTGLGKLFAVNFNICEFSTWEVALGLVDDQYDYRFTPVVGADGTIYVNAGANANLLKAINPATHAVKWTVTTGGTIEATPAIGLNGTLYFGSDDGNLYIVNPTTGHFTTVATPDGAPIESSPVLGANGAVYFGANDGNIYIYNGTTLSTYYDYVPPSGQPVTSSLTLAANGSIYFVSTEDSVYAISSSTLPAASWWPMFGKNAAHVNSSQAATGPLVDSCFNPSTDGPIRDVALQADGKILIVGAFTHVDGQASPAVARLNADGSLDTSFGAAFSLTGYFADMNCVVADSLGRVYIGGDAHDLAGNLIGRMVCVDADGNLLDSSTTGNPLAIIDANGPIYTFSGGGQVLSIPGGPTPPYTDLVVGGNFSGAGIGPVANIGTAWLVPNYDLFYVLIFNNASYGFAEVDSIGWGAPGYLESEEESPGLTSVNALTDNAVKAIGGWIGGEYQSGNLVVGGTGFDQSGLPFTYGDHGVGNANYWAPFGTTLSFSGGLDGGVLAVAIQPDGKVLAGGEFSTFAGYPSGQYPSLARFNANGTADTTFTPPNDWFMNAASGLAGAVDSIVVQSDGKVLAGGLSSMYVNRSHNSGLERFNANGSLDATFNLPVNGSVATLLQQANGEIIVAGSFAAFGSQTHLNIARFWP